MIRAHWLVVAGVLAVSWIAQRPTVNKKSADTAADTSEELRRLDHKALDAEKSLDVALLEHIFAPSYVLVMPNGAVYTKAKWLGILKSPEHPIIKAVDPEDIHVHLFGDLAILTDTTTLRSLDGKGQESVGTYRVFRVMVKEEGTWRVAAVELTPIKSN